MASVIGTTQRRAYSAEGKRGVPKPTVFSIADAYAVKTQVFSHLENHSKFGTSFYLKCQNTVKQNKIIIRCF